MTYKISCGSGELKLGQQERCDITDEGGGFSKGQNATLLYWY